ncbi:MAG: acyl-CoA/acyl-ACP dehydrogenase [Deltaproteobacteria bacterium]|nr:acyl-CoA/acyl-ACP dehydrogenase [Deltaproteobacteria bacterium]MBW2394309.1 acyl-CoA/acyl-ACP dehydrogenase [Deltaproteobacteria bacterium]
MDFSWGSELTSIRREAERLCEPFDDDYWSRCDEAHEFPWAFYRAFAEQGWIGILVPEAYGGAGLGTLHAGALLNAVAASAGAQNAASTLHLSIFGMGPVIHHGSEELKRRTLPPTASGELHVSFGVTEDDAGTDTSRIRTFARREGDGFVVNGKKVWNTKAQQAQKILLLARTTLREECARPLDGMTLFLANLDPDHVEIREIPKLGRNAVNSNEVYIDELPVSAADVVGEVGRGFYHLLDGLNPERIMIAAEAVGIGRRAVDAAARYAKGRIVFDRPIGQNQAIAHPLADSLSELEAADLLWQKAAWAYDSGEPAGPLANMAKLRASEAAFTACDRALQTFGGFGYAREFHVERYWREARLARIAPISNEMVRSYLAEHVLGLPRSH